MPSDKRKKQLFALGIRFWRDACLSSSSFHATTGGKMAFCPQRVRENKKRPSSLRRHTAQSLLSRVWCSFSAGPVAGIASAPGRFQNQQKQMEEFCFSFFCPRRIAAGQCLQNLRHGRFPWVYDLSWFLVDGIKLELTSNRKGYS